MTAKPDTASAVVETEEEAPENPTLVHVPIVLLVNTIGARAGDVVPCNPERAAYLVAEGHAAYPA